MCRLSDALKLNSWFLTPLPIQPSAINPTPKGWQILKLFQGQNLPKLYTSFEVLFKPNKPNSRKILTTWEILKIYTRNNSTTCIKLSQDKQNISFYPLHKIIFFSCLMREGGGRNIKRTWDQVLKSNLTLGSSRKKQGALSVSVHSWRPEKIPYTFFTIATLRFQ